MARKYDVEGIGTVDRVVVFCEVSKEAAGNGVYASHDWDTGGSKTFDYAQRCSTDGQEPATHLMVSHVVDQQFLDGVLSGVSNAPFFDLYKKSDGWSIESALADMGLQIIETEI